MSDVLQRPERVLPVWPVYLMFAGFPVFWVLGFGAFVPITMSAVMVPLLVLRRTIRLPLGFAWWALFVAWAGVAVLQLDAATRLIGYGVRYSNYIGATVLFVYVYNLSERSLPLRRGLIALALFFTVVVVGGYLGVLLPTVRLDTPLHSVLPRGIAQNEYVNALVRPAFAEVQRPYGSPTTFYRPSAPFAYTNSWGCNTALLVPCVVAAAYATTRRVRLAVIGLLAAAVVPAFATLNRGMYIAIGAGLAYAAVRLAARGRVVPLAGLLVMAGLGVGLAVVSGAAEMLQARLEYSQSNESRATIYQEAFDGALASPILGNGAPRPSATLQVSVGTQGQIWNVMFSYGFPALLFFVGWFVWLAWTTRRWRNAEELWLHVSLVVTVLTIFYYGYDGMQLSVTMMAGALAVRAAQQRRAGARPAPVPDAAPVPDPR